MPNKKNLHISLLILIIFLLCVMVFYILGKQITAF